MGRYPIDAVYASNVQWAMETAQFIAHVHALSVTPVPELREANHGKWDAMSDASPYPYAV